MDADLSWDLKFRPGLQVGSARVASCGSLVWTAFIYYTSVDLACGISQIMLNSASPDLTS